MGGLAYPAERSGAGLGCWFSGYIRRGHYELGVDQPMTLRVMSAFGGLALAI
jgi:hypothetical protein